MGEVFELINFNLSDFIFQVINIGILIYFLNKFLFKKVMNVIDERNKEVNDAYKDIDEAWVELEKKDNKYNTLLTNINTESTSIIDKAKEEGKLIKENSLKEAREKAEKEMKKAKISIENEKRNAIEEIKKDISELVVNSTKAVLQEEYSSKDESPVEKQFIDKLGEDNE